MFLSKMSQLNICGCHSRLPSSFITTEVVEATCQCLLAQVEAGQEKGHSDLVVEQLVLQEFGRCLLQIIEYASRTKV